MKLKGVLYLKRHFKVMEFDFEVSERRGEDHFK
jgi:hypothetical protein